MASSVENPVPWPQIQKEVAEFVHSRIQANDQLKNLYYNVVYGWKRIMEDPEKLVYYLHVVFETENEIELVFIESQLANRKMFNKVKPRLNVFISKFRVPSKEEATEFVVNHISKRIETLKKLKYDCSMVMERYGYLDLTNANVANMLYMISKETDKNKVANFEHVSLAKWRLPTIPSDFMVQSKAVDDAKEVVPVSNQSCIPETPLPTKETYSRMEDAKCVFLGGYHYTSSAIPIASTKPAGSQPKENAPSASAQPRKVIPKGVQASRSGSGTSTFRGYPKRHMAHASIRQHGQKPVWNAKKRRDFNRNLARINNASHQNTAAPFESSQQSASASASIAPAQYRILKAPTSTANETMPKITNTARDNTQLEKINNRMAAIPEEDSLEQESAIYQVVQEPVETPILVKTERARSNNLENSVIEMPADELPISYSSVVQSNIPAEGPGPILGFGFSINYPAAGPFPLVATSGRWATEKSCTDDKHTIWNLFNIEKVLSDDQSISKE